MQPATYFKHLIKETLAILLYNMRFGAALRLSHNSKSAPLIFYYHRVCNPEVDFLSSPDLVVSKNNFEKQMEFIKEEFNVLPLDDIIDRLKKGKTLSSRDVAITFDDGYIDNYIHAYPILKKYGIPATIFITTGHIGSNNLLWWDRLSLIIKAVLCTKIKWDDYFSDLLTRELKNILSNEKALKRSLTPLTNYLKSVGVHKREAIIHYLGNTVLKSESILPQQRVFLSWQEIKEMSGSGITFGSHSHTHAILTELDDKDMNRELSFSKELIKENVGMEPKGFSYPDGCLDDRVKASVITSGYYYAVQTNRLLLRSLTDIYSIPRKMIKESHSRGCFREFSKALFTMELSDTANHLFLRNVRRKNPYKH